MTDLSAAARRIVELASKATPGEWEAWAPEGDDELGRCLWSVCADGEDAHHCIATTRHKNDDQAYDNAAFIAHARNHAPALAADYLRLLEAIAAAETSAIMWKARCEQAEPRVAELEAERDRLLAIEQAAHDLLCWTYQHAIMAEPGEYSRHIRDLHPGVINTMNAAECDLYNALSRAALTPKDGGTDHERD